jgi:ABC-type phosphate transport system substrate-binding protein
LLLVLILYFKEIEMKKLIPILLIAFSISCISITAVAETIVVVVNAKSNAPQMTNEQAAQFFLGRSTAMTPVDQSESSPVRAEFYKKLADKEASQVKAIWTKIVFTGKGTLPKDYPNSAEVKKAIAADSSVIGYIEKSAVDSSVKIVATLP